MITKMFPEIDEVFAKNKEEMKKYFFPICSIDLSSLNPDWNEIIHFLIFNEDPYNDETVKFFNHYCEDNSVGFKSTENKFEFLTEIGFMYVRDEWKKWLNKTKNGYQESKELFLTNQSAKDYKSFIKIGGTPDWVQLPEVPTDRNGEELIFIGQFYSSDFTNKTCTKDVFVFYDPNEKIVVHRYQIT